MYFSHPTISDRSEAVTPRVLHFVNCLWCLFWKWSFYKICSLSLLLCLLNMAISDMHNSLFYISMQKFTSFHSFIHFDVLYEQSPSFVFFVCFYVTNWWRTYFTKSNGMIPKEIWWFCLIRVIASYLVNFFHGIFSVLVSKKKLWILKKIS
jgi:hypothetical protein